MRIMIVEDEQRARRGLRNLIMSISDSYEIIAEATNGKRALEIMNAIKPEVVFTDIKMPYMDGMALIKAVNAMGLKVKFVIITAYEEFETARQAVSLDVADYLVKPITYDEVAEVLKKLENKGRSDYMDSGASLQNQYAQVHPLIIKALNIIENGYSARIYQKELAENLGMTQEYFSYLFNREIGEPFSKFLTNYRINIAKKLLINEGVSKEELPYSVGFSDPKYFNKIFRKTTGVSVSEFLRENKK